MIKITDHFCCILNRQWLKGPSIFVTFHEHLLGLLPNQARIPLIQNINKRNLKLILNKDALLINENAKFGCHTHL